MAAHDNLSGQQFRQLDMFRPAGELADPSQTFHGDRIRMHRHGIDPETIHERKLDWAMRADADDTDLEVGVDVPSSAETLYDSIGTFGVREPVNLSVTGSPEGHKNYLTDGHHRVIAAADQNPNAEVPVVWGP
jgi:hypothetical protein